MGLEHFYKFIDRDAVEPLLRLTWAEFLRKYRWSRGSLQESVEEFLAFIMGPQPAPSVVDEVLARRTLRWTMKRSSPKYFFLFEVIYNAPHVRKRCPEIWTESPYEIAIIIASSVDAFLTGKIDVKTLKETGLG